MNKISFVVGWFILLVSYCQNGVARQTSELTLGDTIPKAYLGHLFEAVEKPIYGADLIGDGPLIISFWATWCSPCIKEMRFLDSMKTLYPALNVLAVTYQDRAVIDAFWEKNPDSKPKNVIVSTNDTLLNKVFKHQALPHNVWIDRSGVVVAMTGFDEIVEENIETFVFGRILDVALKKDLQFDWRKPLYVEDSLLHFRSIFQPHIDGVNIGGITTEYSGLGIPNKKRFFGFNMDRLSLIWAAYTRDFALSVNYELVEFRGVDSSKYIWPERDPMLFARSKYKNRTEWINENTFFYELRFPEKVDDDLFYSFMVRDIEYNLGIKAHFENQIRPCRVVQISHPISDMLLADNSEGEPIFEESLDKQLILSNVSLDFFLNWITQQSIGWRDHRSQIEPFVNETGLDLISLVIDIGGMPMDNVRVWEAYLEKLGFVFRTEERSVPVLIISDTNRSMEKH